MQQSAGRFWNELEQTMNPLFYYLTKPLISLVNWRTYLHAYASSFPSLRQDKQEDFFFLKESMSTGCWSYKEEENKSYSFTGGCVLQRKEKNRG